MGGLAKRLFKSGLLLIIWLVPVRQNCVEFNYQRDPVALQHRSFLTLFGFRLLIFSMGVGVAKRHR